MALLIEVTTPLAVPATICATLVGGCSLALDVDALQKGAADASTHIEAGAHDAAASGAPTDAAPDAACTTSAEKDACAGCVAMACCAELQSCTLGASCNLAYVEYQQCTRTAQGRPNPAVASAACKQTFLTRGGTPAEKLAGCTLSNCSTACGGA